MMKIDEDDHLGIQQEAPRTRSIWMKKDPKKTLKKIFYGF